MAAEALTQTQALTQAAAAFAVLANAGDEDADAGTGTKFKGACFIQTSGKWKVRGERSSTPTFFFNQTAASICPAQGCALLDAGPFTDTSLPPLYFIIKYRAHT